MMKTTGMGERVGYAFMDHSPSEIKPYLDSIKPTLEEMVDKANKIIEQKFHVFKRHCSMKCVP